MPDTAETAEAEVMQVGSVSARARRRAERTAARAAARSTPFGWRRVVGAYALIVLALACGIPAVIVGWISADHCTAEGFGCLDRLIYGALAAALIAVCVLLALAVRYRLGVGFWLIYLVITVAVVGLVSVGPYTFGVALLCPGLAAWVSEPPRSGHSVRHWLPRLIGLIMLAVLAAVVATAD